MRFFLFLLFFTLGLKLFSQYSYKNYGTKLGLIQASNYFMLNDKKGYLWLSSEEGLSKFDGKRFENYYYSPLDNESVYGSYINNFIEVDNSSLIVASNKGLSFYNSVSNSFKRINVFKESVYITANTYIINKTADQLLIIDNINGLYKFDIKSQTAVFIDSSVKLPNQYLSFATIKYNKTFNTLYFVNTSGLIRYSLSDKKKELLAFNSNEVKSKKVSRIFTLFLQSDTVLLAGTDKGVLYLSTSTFKIIKHLNLPNPPKTEVYSIGEDLDKSIWIGGNCGIVFKIVNNKLQPIELSFETDEKKQLKDIMQFHFTDENIFINEDNVGLGVINRSKKYLTTFNKKNSNTLFKKEQSVFCITEDSDKKILIGKYNDDILVYDPNTNLNIDFFRKYQIDLTGYQIRYLYTQQKLILIATTKGLLEYDKIKKRLYHYRYDNYSPSEKSVWIEHIANLNSNELLAASRDGIFKIDINKKMLSLISFNNENSYFLFKNKKNEILSTGKNNCLVVYNYDGIKLSKNREYLKEFEIMNMWEDTLRNEYWLATREGIVHTNNKYERLHFFNTNNGLKSNCFYGIVPDDLGNIWCSSNHGIATINLTTKEIYYHFSDTELSGLEYNGKSFFKASNGYLYFGSELGYDIIKPKELFERTINPVSIEIEGVEINGKKASYAILEMKEYNHFYLTYSQNQVAFKVNTVNYNSNINYKLNYKIDGVQNNWVEINNDEWIRITKLKPGSYKIVIQINDKYFKKERIILIDIKPAWYQTIIFKVLIALVVLSILYILYNFRIRQLKRILSMRQKISANLHDDIGSTLSSINMYSQIAQLKPSDGQHIQTIQQNTQEALQKLDDIVWATNPKNDQIKNLIERINNFSKELLKAKNVNFNFDYDEAITNTKINEAARQNLFLICKEAVNNIAKYAQAKNCKISISIKNKNINCIIADDGIGFDTKLPTERNGLLNMQLRTQQLKGKFAIDSLPYKGTTINVQLPL